MDAGITPPDARRRSSFDAHGVVSKHGRSVVLSESSSENMMGSGGLYGFLALESSSGSQFQIYSLNTEIFVMTAAS